MKRSGNGNDTSRRIALLEKAYLEDRARWQKHDEVFLQTLRAIKGQGEEIKEQVAQIKAQGAQTDAQGKRLDLFMRQSEERWKKNEERWKKNEERWKKSDERLEVAIRNLHRLMER